MKLVYILCIVLLGTLANAQTKLFNGNFETNTMNGYYADGNDAAITTVQKRLGGYGMIAHVDHDTSSNEYRTEVVVRADDETAWSEATHTPYFFDFGKPYWIAISIYLPSDFVLDNSAAPEIVFQVHNQPDVGETYTNPILAIQIDSVDWNVYSRGSDDVPTEQYVWDVVRTTNCGPVTSDKGRWTDWVFHVEFNWTSNGFLAIYKNRVLVDSVSGLTSTRDDVGPYTKFGIYKWAWASPGGTFNTTTRTIYFDEFAIGDSLMTLNLMSPDTTYGRTFHTAKTGLNTNPGTEAEPFLTIGYGISQMAGGDTLVIHSGSYSNDPIAGVPSGTATHWSCVKTYGTDTVCILDASRAGVYLIGKDYVSIRGDFRIRSSALYGLRVVQDCDRIFLHKLRFYQVDSPPFDVNIIQGDTTAPYSAIYPSAWIWIDSCYFEEKMPNTVTINVFKATQIDSLYIVGSDFTKCTHYAVLLNAQHFILRGNYFYNTHGSFEARGKNQYGMIEHNRFYQGKNDSAGTFLPLRAGGSGQIVGMKDTGFRFNMIYDDTVSWTSAMEALHSWTPIDGDDADSVMRNVLYNNTFYGYYDPGNPSAYYTSMDTMWYIFQEHLGSAEADTTDNDYNRYLNNIFAYARHGTATTMGGDFLLYLRNEKRGAVNQFTHWWNGNCLWDGTRTNLIHYDWSSGYDTLTITEAKASFGSLWGAANINVNPKFADTTVQGRARSFALDSASTLIGAGVPIDTVKSNVTGTRIAINNNAAAFCGGYGFITGDSIRIGSTTVTVTGVNYSPDSIYVNAAVVASAGDPIWLYRNGQVINDIGAVEYGAAVKPPTPGAKRYLKGSKK